MFLRTLDRGVARSVCTGALSLLALAGAAAGQCSVYRLDVQDFDQRRTAGNGLQGLPGGGNAYCVPTAAANWLAYIGTHGYPQVWAPANWQSDLNYAAATAEIAQLGVLMSTSTSTGTNYGVCSGVLQSKLDAVAPGAFLSFASSANGNYSPSAADMYNLMMAGQLISVGTHRYTLVPAGNGFPQRYVRVAGGHAVSVSRVYDACTNSPTLYFRDPAAPNDGNTLTQSAFASFAAPLQPVNALYAGAANTPPVSRTAYRLTTSSGFSCVGTLMIISPKFGLTADAQSGQFSVHNLHHPGSFDVQPAQTHSTPGGVPVGSVKFFVDGASVLVLTRPTVGSGGDPQLLRFMPGDGGIWRFEPIGTFPGMQSFVVGRFGDVYLRSSTLVIRIDFQGPTPTTQTMAVNGVDAIAYDDVHDEIVTFSGASRTIGTIARSRFGQAQAYQQITIPATVPPLAGDLSVAVSPVDGGIWIAAGDVDGAWGLTKTGTGTLTLAGSSPPAMTPHPRNLQIDHRGNLVFTSQGVVRELRRNPANGQWETDPSSKFAGLPAAGLFEQSAARSNVDDTLTPETDAQDVPPVPLSTLPAIVECRADFNGDGTATVQDIFDFLAAWFAGSTRADFNFSSSATVQDIFDFLAAWFAPCP